ncbi:hypothetical protein L1N85_02015 [Paenibacillus alkaliterrae]|uniref:hypothetical protein n=1 Tax=Paenibacillus alkaliterrae TaxID=320909 RepID=UPI001F3E9960|nr:hypothetical protein [Paenibacillus alkaliterrae]MCF2937204.1 hypothetical protein [Paenibacillus alkaliterrae]
MEKEKWLIDPIGSAERGENPTVLARMKTGFALIGLTQFLPGYCLLMRSPQIKDLTDLSMNAYVEAVCDGYIQ